MTSNVLQTVLSALVALAPAAPARPAPTTVSIQFDDGRSQQDVRALLARHRLHATFFINSATVGTPDVLTWRDLRALKADGHEIAGHTRTHADLTKLSASAQRHEICDDRATLAAHGLPPVDFAYPYGRYTAVSKRIVRSCGYASARRAGGLSNARFAVNRMRLRDRFAIPTAAAPVDTTTAADVERAVNDASTHGGGWVQVFWHRICPDDCHRYSWPAERLDEVLTWLRGEVDAGRVRVATVQQALTPAGR